MKKVCIAALCVLLLGSAYGVIYWQSKSELNLAEIKSDLDGMYRSLERLAALQIPSASNRLEQVSYAIKMREEMLRAAADHDHEKAVLAAGKLLETVPTHTDGIKILRESGQIFFLLRHSLHVATEALKSTEPLQAYWNPLSFETHEISNEKNERLIKNIQQGLSTLGLYTEPVNGIFNSDTAKSLSKFAKDINFTGDMPISDKTANEISKAIALKKAKVEWSEKKFFDINKARELAQTALYLDQKFEQARILTDELDKIHESYALLQSENILKMGKATLLIAEAFHNQIIGILSKSDSVSKTYSAMKPHLDSLQKIISPWRESMEQSMKLIATYKGSRSNEYFTTIKEYFHTVQFGVEALLVPSGNLIQFRQAGNDTLQKFSSIQVKLASSRPNSASLHETFEGFIKALGEYKIFKDPQTEKVIDSFSSLYTL